MAVPVSNALGRAFLSSGGWSLANLEANEATDSDLIAKLLSYGPDVLLNRHLGIPFHKSLIHQAVSLIKLFQFAIDDLGHCLRRLILDLLAGNFPFFRNNIRRDLFPRDYEGMTGGNLERNVFHELLKILGCNRGFFFCPNFHQNTDLVAGVEVGSNHTVAGDLHASVARDKDVISD